MMKNEFTLDAFLKESHTGVPKTQIEETAPPLPIGWKVVDFLDVIEECKTGIPIKKVDRVPGDYPYYGANGIIDYVKDYIFDGEYVLIAQDGSIGAIHYVNGKFWGNNHLWAVRVKANILARFLCNFLKTVDWSEIIRGATRPKVTKKYLASLKIPLPPLDVQRRVVARIEELMSRIEQAKKLREEALKDTEAIMQSALHQTFSNAERDHGLKTLSEVCEINPSKKEIRNLSDDIEVTFVPMSAVSEVTGRIENPSTRLLRDVKKGYTYFREGDVLFAKITPCMENGKSAIAQNLVNGLGFGSTEFHVIRPSNETIAKWVYYFIRQKSFRELAARNMTGSVGQQRVPDEFVKSARIPVPPVPDQKCFVEYLDKIAAKIETLKKHQEESKEKIEVMTQAVLKRAFSGNL
jgi:type I restriction enzyme S subunit